MTKEMVVIGMGYVGIPAAALFANVPDIHVTGLQRRSKRSGWKLDVLNSGKCPIGGDEPILPELLEKVVKEGKFEASDDFSKISKADYILIDVQTPTEADHMPKYESLREVSTTVGKYMKKGSLVVIESTVAPGTTDNIAKPILERESGMKAGTDFYLAFAYERVMVGRLINNITNYPRIVGGINRESTVIAAELYRKITKAEVYETDALTSEVSKVVENTYRDVNIAFANEVALICESMGISVYDVRKFVNTLPKNSNAYRNMHLPGVGVGGHCLPKDPWLLKYGLDKYGGFEYEPTVITHSRVLNDYMPIHTARLMKDALEEAGVNMDVAKVALLGYAFLENSDDTRNTPSLAFYKYIHKDVKEIRVHDPYVRDEEAEVDGIKLDRDIAETVKDADAVVISTAHKEYFSIDIDELAKLVRTPVIIDGRNVFDADKVREKGFIYRGIGKPIF